MGGILSLGWRADRWREPLGMSTLDDMASDAEMRDRALCEKVAREQSKPIKYNGRCLNVECNTLLPNGLRYCPGEDCKEQFEFQQKMRRIMGR